MSAKLVLDLVEAVRKKLGAHPETFELKELSGARATDAQLDAVAARLDVELPELLRALHREIGAPFGLYWTVKDGGELDPDDCPIGQLELVATDDLRFVRSGERVMRFTNDGHGNGFALDYRKKGAPKLVWWDHDEQAATPRKEKTLEALFKAWANELFVNTASEPNDLDPVLELTGSKPAPAGSRREMPALHRGLTELALPAGASPAGIAFDESRLYVSTYEGTILAFDLESRQLVGSTQKSFSMPSLVRLPDGRLLGPTVMGVFAIRFPEIEREPWLRTAASALVSIGEDVLASAGNKALLIDSDGKTKTTFELPRPFASVAGVGEQLVFAFSGKPMQLAAFDRTTGRRLWLMDEKAVTMPGALLAHEGAATMLVVGGGSLKWDAEGKRAGKPAKKALLHASTAKTGEHLLGGWISTLEIFDRRATSLRSITLLENQVPRIHVSPDERHVVLRGDSRIYIADVHTLVAGPAT